MRSIVAALILTVGLILPGAGSALAQGESLGPRVIRNDVFSLKSGEGSHSLLRLEKPATVTLVVQLYAQDEGRQFVSVDFGPIGPGQRWVQGSALDEYHPFLMVEELPAGIHDGVIRVTGPTLSAYYPPAAPGQRMSLYIAAEPVP